VSSEVSSFAGVYGSAKVTRSKLLFASFLVEHNIPNLVIICQFCQLNSGQNSQEVVVCVPSNVVKMLTISAIFEPPNLPIFGFMGLAALQCDFSATAQKLQNA